MLKQFKKDIDAIDEETMDESDQSIDGNQNKGRMSRMNIETEAKGGRMMLTTVKTTPSKQKVK